MTDGTKLFVPFSDNLNFNEDNLCCYVDENRFFLSSTLLKKRVENANWSVL